MLFYEITYIVVGRIEKNVKNKLITSFCYFPWV